MDDRAIPVRSFRHLLTPILVLLVLFAVVRPVQARAAAPSPGSAATSASTSVGPVTVGDAEVTVDGRTFGAWLLHPDPAGDGDAAAGPWPVVIFGHGFLTPVERYATTLRALAGHGFLVVAPRSGGELFPDHAAFAADLSAVIDWLEVEHVRPDGLLEGRVDLERVAVSGHSMGGGASILAAAEDPRIRTVATLAAADTRPSAVEAAARLTVPSLLIAGELDAIAPIADHQRPIFEAAEGAPAQLRTILGGSHCGFTDAGSGGLIGELSGLVCDTGTISEATQQAITVRLLVDWLRVHLGDAADPAAMAWPDDPVDGTTVESRRP